MSDDGTAASAGAWARDGVMSLGQHLEELRRRLILCVVVVLGATVVSWALRDQVMAVLMRPHVQAMAAIGQDPTLKYASYMEPVLAQIKATLIAAVLVTAPFLLFQFWGFIAPGLFPHERKKVLKIFWASAACFAAGVAFGYFVFIPIVFRYLLILAGPSTQPVIMIGTYLSTFFMLTFAMGIAFQTPVVIACLIRWNIVQVQTLQRHRRAVILIAFIVAGVITPTVDPVSQIVTAIPLVVLYDLGALVAAPSRSTLLSFCQFTGIIVVAAAGVLLYMNFWPVAHATTLKGQAQLAGKELAVGQTVPVLRGTLCETGEGALLKVSFGGSDGAVLYLSGPASLLAHGPDKVTLLEGDGMAVSPSKDEGLAVFAGPAMVTVADARAEITVPDPDTATVSVFAGQVKAQSEGAERQVKAGRRQTFYRGGEPANLNDAEKRWQDLIGPAASGPAAGSPAPVAPAP